MSLLVGTVAALQAKSIERVGWVERSETHHFSAQATSVPVIGRAVFAIDATLHRPAVRWVSLRSTHPTGYRDLDQLEDVLRRLERG